MNTKFSQTSTPDTNLILTASFNKILNSGYAQVQMVVALCLIFAAVRISDNVQG